MEWLFFVLVVGHKLLTKNIRIPLQPYILNIFIAFVLGILMLQTFVFLPDVVERANKIISNQPVESSLAHLFYIVAELVKVSFLIIVAVMINRQILNP